MVPAIHEAAPEKRLLVCCARTRMTPEAAGQVRALCQGPIRWEYLLQSAAENSVLPLLSLHLPALAPEVFSQSTLDQLKAAARAAAVHSLQLSAELVRVLDALDAAGIEALPYKGPVLALQAYGDLALREYEDLDLILPQSQIARAHQAMVLLGYRPRYPWVVSAEGFVPGEYHYVSQERGKIVELHTERTLRHFPVVPNLAAMNRRAVTVTIGDRPVRTFSPEDTLILLCIHGSKDFWERISWIADVAEFLARHSSLDWEAVWRRAESLHGERMVRLGLALAARLLDAPLHEDARRRIDDDLVVGWLAGGIEERLLARSAAPRGLAAGFHFRRQTVPGALASWEYALRLTLAPAEQDMEILRLPKALAPLYLLMRPIRLAGRYATQRKRTGAAP